MNIVPRMCMLLPVIIACSFRPAQAQQYHAYMTLESDKQGLIKINTKAAKDDGRTNDYLSLTSLKVSGDAPAAARGQHKPIVITREADEASPSLYQMCTSNEVFRTVVIRYIGTDGPNKNKVFRVITLKNAVISKAAAQPGPPQPANHTGHAASEMQGFAFRFTDILIENPVPSTTTTDDVNAHDD